MGFSYAYLSPGKYHQKENTMSKHPYPDHVRQAIATTIARQVLVMRSWSDLTKQTLDAFLTDADEVLQALWDASRIDDVEQVDELPNDAVLIDRNRAVADDYVTHCIIDLPAHVLHWGDTDE